MDVLVIESEGMILYGNKLRYDIVSILLKALRFNYGKWISQSLGKCYDQGQSFTYEQESTSNTTTTILLLLLLLLLLDYYQEDNTLCCT